MIEKVFKAVWFLSLMATVIIFLFVYASLPEDILLTPGEVTQSISRNVLFYSALSLLAMFNAAVFVISRLYSDKNEYFRAWFYGLIVFFNLFFVVVLQLVNVYNSNEKFDYERIGPIIYGSIGMIVLWSSLWPLYFIAQQVGRKLRMTNDE